MSASQTRECPFCAETIKAAALLCRFCGRDLLPPGNSTEPAPVSGALPGVPSIDPGEIFDLLTMLVEKSLVVYEEDEQGHGRYRLLETVRQYARDRLLEAGESRIVRTRHLDCYLELAERAEPELRGRDQVVWLDRLGLEHENLRAALAWSKENQVEAGLRLASALWRFWVVRCHWQEGREAVEELLPGAGPALDTGVRARALFVAGHLAFRELPPGWEELAIARLEESLGLFESLEDKEGIAYALVFTGWLIAESESERAAALAEQSLALFRKLGDTFGMAFALWLLRRKEEWVAVSREGGHKELLAWALGSLAEDVERQGESERAQALREESLLLHEELGNKLAIAWHLFSEAERAFGQKEYERAAALFRVSLPLLREVWRPAGIIGAFSMLARMAIAEEQPERAARLRGAAEALQESIQPDQQGPEDTIDAVECAALRAAMGEEAFERVWASGRAMTPQQAIDYALTREDVRS